MKFGSGKNFDPPRYGPIKGIICTLISLVLINKKNEYELYKVMHKSPNATIFSMPTRFNECIWLNSRSKN